MVRSCGAVLGFFAFSVTILLGMSAGNPVPETLIRAIQALFLFFFLGLLVGWVAYRVVDEHAIRRNKEMFPSPEPTEPGADENLSDRGASTGAARVDRA